ncbi:MAG: Valine--tRNA ligase [Actinobacteria bacterium ADurb.Bin346]|nr:MAG: Valine--tRNA ligase [Actinobacteria bacterium ADurb.Bin346]
MEKLPDKYNPAAFEDKIYKKWLEKGYFHGEISKAKTPFSIVIPPPNVTGYLHVGHALNNTLQDIMIRHARMKGFAACWIPGTDHAGIATQNVIEKELNKKGITRFALGREKFIEKVWEWRNQYGSRIISQLKSLGCSCDWERLRFTLDEEYAKAVTHEFVKLYEAGLIYRGNYMVNWCPRCLTAISDIEVEHKEKKGNLWDIRYPLIEEETGLPDKNEFITVSTTRPETMLGDTAVAVNPSDKRYKKLAGRFVLLPLMQRKIPVVQDAYVDAKFGTGAVKVTPAHDPNDFEIAGRHGLDRISIMTDSGIMNENAGPYKGLDRYEARKKILSDLEASGYLAGKKTHVSSMGFCSRCDTVVEPRISPQWFVSMKSLAAPAIKAVRGGQIKFIPKKWEKLYFNWMENIRDWCISRQLWWGHRIPVWYCSKCGEMTVTVESPVKCKCGSNDFVQDEDVLDTWFSSCLWPFAVMGWPQDTEDLKYFFPTDVLITAHDIIFFWVARMIMMSLYFMDEIPFREVFINPLVNDVFGQKMSKSRGNVIDPMTIIEKNGADALRFALASLTTPGRNLLLGEEKIEGSRNFANKIWNASKFVLANLDGIDIKSIETKKLDLKSWDRWILSKLAGTIKSVEKYLEKYNISFACRALSTFFWNDFCDWYIEVAKVTIYSANLNESQKTATKYVLWYVLERYLKLLHPFMPFITEEIWQSLQHEGESIMISEFPAVKKTSLEKIDPDVEEKTAKVSNIISEIRKIRSEHSINPASKVNVFINPLFKDISGLIQENADYIMSLARVKELQTGAPSQKSGFVKSLNSGSEIYVNIFDAIDTDQELKRINEEIARLQAEISKSMMKLENPQFIQKAPREIIDKEKNKLDQAQKAKNALQEQQKYLKSFKDNEKIQL